jgi:hypothetical protein
MRDLSNSLYIIGAASQAEEINVCYHDLELFEPAANKTEEELVNSIYCAS